MIRDDVWPVTDDELSSIDAPETFILYTLWQCVKHEAPRLPPPFHSTPDNLQKGKNVFEATLSLEDRQALYDALARYVWGMDTGDIEAVVATFTPDGTVKDITGKRWDADAGGVRGFATHFLTRPTRRGGQHHVQPLFVDIVDDRTCRVTSYWFSIQWNAEHDMTSIRAMGSYVDTCLKVRGKWLIQEKIIDPWNSETAPMVGAHGHIRRFS